MGMFSFMHNNRDPMQELARRKQFLDERLNAYYDKLMQQGQHNFYRSGFCNFLGTDFKSDDIKLINERLTDDMVKKRIYASWQEFCPTCRQLVAEGPAVPVNGLNGSVQLSLRIGNVPLMELNLVCPYCQQKLPKTGQLQIAAKSIIYHLTPQLIDWYQKQMQNR